LDEGLAWAKDKTILMLDKKTVPLELTEKKIREHRAENYAMVIAYSFEEAKRYFRLNENIMMEVFIPTAEKLEDFGKTGVPWRNIVAFIAHAKPEDKGLYKKRVRQPAPNDRSTERRSSC
jgi:glycerophosphoryl diester phosphodiesterase